MTEILTAEQICKASALTIEAGTTAKELMHSFGHEVTDLIRSLYKRQPVLILAGPGKNGSDGLVIANHILEQRWPVRVCFIGNVDELSTEAKAAYEKYPWEILSLSELGQIEEDLIIDSLFGSGLNREIASPLSDLIHDLNQSSKQIISLDIPSGIGSESGQILGMAFKATHTISFLRPKFGHLLFPGKAHCGQLHLINSGILEATVSALRVKYWQNEPFYWRSLFPRPKTSDHKYSRGHALIFGGDRMTGAARLTARAARRTGAGLVTIASHDQVRSVYQYDTGVIVDSWENWDKLLNDPRIGTVAIGPGAETTMLKSYVISLCKYKKRMVLDADVLTAFSNERDFLFQNIQSNSVLTPHEGEFRKLFPELIDAPIGRVQQALEAAKQSRSIVVFKGNQTVIAAPDGRAFFNNGAPPTLATAGTGDVLTGIITGLLAQGVPAFEASAMAVWIHGEAAKQFGAGLIAEDLPDLLPSVFENFF